MKWLCTVVTDTGTREPGVPGGASARTNVVAPQSSAPRPGRKLSAARAPNQTPSGQPRLDPRTVTRVPPPVEPVAGMSVLTAAAPGAYNQMRPPRLRALQPLTVQASTWTRAGVWDTVVVRMLPRATKR